MPVTPSSSQALRPETTADSATTTRFIRRPPRKNSLTPGDENRAAQTPIAITKAR